MICRLCKREIRQQQNRNRTRCNSCNTKIRRYRTKMAAIKLLGGKCSDCGWSGNQAGFEFHHPDDDKKFEIGSAANKSWDSIVEEIRKCELLCATCHRIKHSERNDPMFLDEVSKYKGKLGSVAQG